MSYLMVVTSGQMLGHYRILERLGAGGMGVVYKALDTHLNRTVAIKVLPPESVADPARRQRFIQEAHAASALDHPNIVTVYDIAEAEGQHFIVMQYVAGRTLRALLVRGTPALADTLRYSIQIADALARAHSKGIVHRDLKPENVMVTDEGQVKVLDFGLAKLTETSDPAEGATLTREAPLGATEEGQVVGTAAYMSPEQAQGKKVDARTDIFSFGILLYEMISGRQPFRGDNRLAVLSAIVRDEPEKPAAALPELERLIGRALRKDPERRAQSMADIRNALADLKEETQSGAAATTVQPARRRRPWIPAAALAIVVVAGAAAWFRFGRTQPEAPLPPSRAVPFTSFPGKEVDPAFSPDGNQIAFAWDGEKGDNVDIYVKLIGAGAPLRLTTNPVEDRFPAWSPDGKYIAFHRGIGPGMYGEIWIVPALGGPERKVASGYRHFWGAGAVAWSPDGKWLALEDRASPQEPLSLFLLSLETGERRKLTTPPDISDEDSQPAFSPDGHSLAFARLRGISRENLYLIALDPQGRPSGEPQRVSFDAYIDGLSRTPDSRSIVFSGNVSGNHSLYRVSVRGRAAPGEPERLTSIGGDAFALSISRQGRLAYQQSVNDVNIWRRPGPLGTGSPTQLIASTKLDTAAQYSPDGRRIAFVSDRSGSPEIWVSDSDGSGASPVTSINAGNTGSPRWSPDGRWIAFDSTRYGHRDIFVVAAERGFLRRLTTEASDEARPSWSIDGRWIYFGSNRSGDWQVWKAPAEGGAAVQVTHNGGREAFESLDGKFVYYTKQMPVAGVWRVPPGGGEEIQVIDRGAHGGWAIISEGIGFFSFPDSGPVIEFFRFSTGAITQIAALPKGTRIHTGSNYLAISRDLRWILYNQIDRVESDIMLVENFR